MEKKFLNYTIYPTVSTISKRDARIYRVESVSKEELIRKIEILEGEKIPRMEAEISHLKQVEQRMAAMEKLFLQLTLGQLKIGDSFTFGKYQGEPIEWQVLDVTGGKALLLSRYGLDAIRYHQNRDDVTWEECTLRQWLNQELYKNAFSAGEQNRILKANLVNADNPDYGTAGGNNTEDQVFLLSIADSRKYLKDDSARKCIPTAYAKKQGAYVDKNTGTCYWWLRSPGIASRGAAVVSSGGSVNTIGFNVDYGNVVVRPALWINLES